MNARVNFGRSIILCTGRDHRPEDTGANATNFDRGKSKVAATFLVHQTWQQSRYQYSWITVPPVFTIDYSPGKTRLPCPGSPYPMVCIDHESSASFHSTHSSKHAKIDAL